MAVESQLVSNFFRDLEDPTKFEKVDGVPVFCPHVAQKLNKRTGKQERVEVTDDDIRDAAAEMKRLEKERGVLSVITPGHRNLDPAFPEEMQPKVWGYARAGEFGSYALPDGKQVPCLLTTFYYDRSVRAEDGQPANLAARTYPFRSVDFYSGTKQVSGIALLRRDPQLDLGLLSYGRESGIFSYAEENLMPAPTEPPSAAVLPGQADEELTPEEAQTAMRYMKHYEKHHPPTQYMCMQHAAMMGAGGVGGMGAPAGAPAGGGMGAIGGHPAPLSATNGAVPHPKEPGQHEMPSDKIPSGKAETILKDKEVKGHPLTEKQRGMFGAAAGKGEHSKHERDSAMDVEQYAREIAILTARDESKEKRIAALEQELAVTRERGKMAQYEAWLENAATEGFAIDKKKFLELNARLEPDQFQKQLEFTKEMMPQAPVDRMRGIFAGNGSEGSTSVNSDGRSSNGRLPQKIEDGVMQYMRTHPECGDWDQAEAIVRREMSAAK